MENRCLHIIITIVSDSVMGEEAALGNYGINSEMEFWAGQLPSGQGNYGGREENELEAKCVKELVTNRYGK